MQGTHIVLPFAVTAGIYYVESPTDGRAVFVMPWHGATLIGTTETPYHGAPDQVHPLPEEEEYLLAVARHYFPAFRHLTREHITQRFAGLRVLPAATQAAFDRSRETIFSTDREPKPRVLGIYGGKLTGWRAAAAHVLRAHQPVLAGCATAGRDGPIDFEETRHDQEWHGSADPYADRHARARRRLSEPHRRTGPSVPGLHARSSTTTSMRLDSSQGLPGTPDRCGGHLRRG